MIKMSVNRILPLLLLLMFLASCTRKYKVEAQFFGNKPRRENVIP